MGFCPHHHPRHGVSCQHQEPYRQVNGHSSKEWSWLTAPILLRLAERYGLYGGTDPDAFEILRWLFWDNHKLTRCMASYRFLRTFTPDPDVAVLAFLQQFIDTSPGTISFCVRNFIVDERVSCLRNHYHSPIECCLRRMAGIHSIGPGLPR